MSDVLTERDDGVLTITLNRPDKLNAFTGAMHAELAKALKAARDPDVRAVVIAGAGRGFCVGQDLSEFEGGTGDIAQRLRTTYNPNVLALRSLEKPVIAAVNGPAAGAGLSFACACDIRIASDAASFVPAFGAIGLVPDTGGSYFVAQLLGYARAFEWMTSGRKLGPDEALAWGLVSEVVSADGLAGRAAELAAGYAAMPTRGIGMTKRLLDRAATVPLAEQLEWEAELQAAATKTADFAEGVAAFLEKREPRFEGR
jgi:2-(1,2-epoxy-1,2-dihydrophenyl)acetyl-CoA isomerase